MEQKVISSKYEYHVLEVMSLKFQIYQNDKLKDLISWNLNIPETNDGFDSTYLVCPYYICDKYSSESMIKDFYHEVKKDMNRIQKKNFVFFYLEDTYYPEIFDEEDIVFIVGLDKPMINKHSLHFHIQIEFMNLIQKFKQNISPINEEYFDIGFQGGMTAVVRTQIKDCLDICKKEGLKTYYKMHKTSFFSFENKKSKKETERDINSYFSKMINTKFVLCPRGVNLSSVRLYETLAVGKTPVIIADNLELPLKNILNWEEFAVIVPEKDILNTYKYIRDFKRKDTTSIFKEYFDYSKLNNFVINSLQKKLFL